MSEIFIYIFWLIVFIIIFFSIMGFLYDSDTGLSLKFGGFHLVLGKNPQEKYKTDIKEYLENPQKILEITDKAKLHLTLEKLSGKLKTNEDVLNYLKVIQFVLTINEDKAIIGLKYLSIKNLNKPQIFNEIQKMLLDKPDLLKQFSEKQ